MKFYKDNSTNYIWKFYMDENKWYWRQLYPNGIEGEESDKGFEDWDECRNDAMKHGMVCKPNLKVWDIPDRI